MKRNESTREVLVQDFIRGIESMVIIVEMGNEVSALAPIDWVFAPKTQVDKAWLTYGTKFEGLAEGSVHFEFISDEPRRVQDGCGGFQRSRNARPKSLGSCGFEVRARHRRCLWSRAQPHACLASSTQKTANSVTMLSSEIRIWGP
jgi:hypothetical protein